MVEFSHVIADPEGLHARPVTEIAAEALRWDARTSITVRCHGRDAAARDLVQLMALRAHKGDELVFRLDGPDAQEAAQRLQTLAQGI